MFPGQLHRQEPINPGQISPSVPVSGAWKLYFLTDPARWPSLNQTTYDHTKHSFWCMFGLPVGVFWGHDRLLLSKILEERGFHLIEISKISLRSMYLFCVWLIRPCGPWSHISISTHGHSLIAYWVFFFFFKCTFPAMTSLTKHEQDLRGQSYKDLLYMCHFWS